MMVGCWSKMAGAGRNLVHSPESGDQPPDRGSRLYQGVDLEQSTVAAKRRAFSSFH